MKLGLILFRNHDLRLVDNPAIYHAVQNSDIQIPFYIFSDPQSEVEVLGCSQRARASEVWISQAVESLKCSLKSQGNQLIIRCIGKHTADNLVNAIETLTKELYTLLGEKTAGLPSVELFMNIRFEPKARVMDDLVKDKLESKCVQAVHTYNASLLYDPKDVNLMLTDKWTGHWGTLMPFLNTCRKIGKPPIPLPEVSLRIPQELNGIKWPKSEEPQLEEQFTLWSHRIKSNFEITEKQAACFMNAFLQEGGLANYERERSRVDKSNSVSKLSAYLRHGLLSPRVLYWATENAPISKEDKKTFGRRLHWRDLAYFQLDTFPEMSNVSIRRHYDKQRWNQDAEKLKAWKKGMTGFPMVDAAMRELWSTGWMHQSMRMVVASFLIEFMGIDWRHGLKWFHDTLVDADVAINSMMWQNAGRSGIDQWNFILRPDGDGRRDPQGRYVRKWCPELKNMPLKYLCKPYAAPEEVLQKANIVLGLNYPHPIISDLNSARHITYQYTIECRRLSQSLNDNGYDLIDLPNSIRICVFTKKEFRIDKEGNLLHNGMLQNNGRNSTNRVSSTQSKRKKRK